MLDIYKHIYLLSRYVLTLRFDYDLRNGMLNTNVVGDVSTVNGGIPINIGANLTIGEVSTLGISGHIDIDKNLIPKDIVQQVSTSPAIV